jgi:hypothetical protein
MLSVNKPENQSSEFEVLLSAATIGVLIEGADHDSEWW